MTDADRLSAHELFERVVDSARRKGVDIADPSPPLDEHVLVSGHALHLLDWQGTQRRPMLLLHGALLQAHVWDFFCLDMRRDFRIRALDLAGHGDSDWMPDADYRRTTAADLIVELIDQLDLTGLVLVGHSFGGAVSAIVAARRPERVASLVMIDSTLVPTGLPSVRTRAAGGPQTFASFDDFAQHAAGLGRRREPPTRPSLSLRWNARRGPDGQWTWKYDPALRHAPLGPSDFEDVWSALWTVRCPMLFVRAGEHSHVIEAAAERLRALPNLRMVVVPDAAHNVMTDNPVGFRREVGKFLGVRPTSRFSA